MSEVWAACLKPFTCWRLFRVTYMYQIYRLQVLLTRSNTSHARPTSFPARHAKPPSRHLPCIHRHVQITKMLLPTYATSPQTPTPSSAYLTTLDTPTTTLTQQEPFTSREALAKLTLRTATSIQTSRRRNYQLSNVAMANIPTTFVTVTTILPAVATQWVTVPATAFASATDSMAATTKHVSEAQGGQPAGIGVPDQGDWPPLLTVFLLCWVAVAWAVAVVLYFATFTEKMVWLDGVVGRLRGRGHRDRYMRNKNGLRDGLLTGI
jgi:hypothetical protein